MTKIRAEIRILTGALLDRVELQGWKKKKKRLEKALGNRAVQVKSNEHVLKQPVKKRI